MLRARSSHLAAPVAVVVFFSTLAGCATVPVTGRSQLSLIPAGEMLSMSETQYSQFLKEHPPSKDAEGAALVRKVGVRIQHAVETYAQEKGFQNRLAGYEWEFNLVDGKEVNAWCMPGGKVVVYSGLLPVAETEEGLAVVMGHEIAHAVAEHGSERMSQQLLTQMGGAALSAAVASKPQETQQLWMTAFGVGAQYGALMPFGRQQESEADRLGLVFMALAGYTPETAVSFWERMAEAKQGQAPPEFLSTHPSDETRIRQIKEYLPEARSYYRKPAG